MVSTRREVARNTLSRHITREFTSIVANYQAKVFEWDRHFLSIADDFTSAKKNFSEALSTKDQEETSLLTDIFWIALTVAVPGFLGAAAASAAGKKISSNLTIRLDKHLGAVEASRKKLMASKAALKVKNPYDTVTIFRHARLNSARAALRKSSKKTSKIINKVERGSDAVEGAVEEVVIESARNVAEKTRELGKNPREPSEEVGPLDFSSISVWKLKSEIMDQIDANHATFFKEYGRFTKSWTNTKLDSWLDAANVDGDKAWENFKSAAETILATDPFLNFTPVSLPSSAKTFERRMWAEWVLQVAADKYQPRSLGMGKRKSIKEFKFPQAIEKRFRTLRITWPWHSVGQKTPDGSKKEFRRVFHIGKSIDQKELSLLKHWAKLLNDPRVGFLKDRPISVADLSRGEAKKPKDKFEL